MSNWRRFRPAGRRAAVHTSLRLASLPVQRLLRVIPRQGNVLDLGCGHGVISFALGDRNQQGSVTGVDIDEHKIEVAQAASQRMMTGQPPTFQVVDQTWGATTGARYDIVVVVDMLYLLGEPQATEAIGRLIGLVAPDGTLVVKEMSRSPRWKTLIDRLQETASVQWLGITQGSNVAPLHVEDIVARLNELGWSTSVHRLDSGYPHAHAAVVAQPPSTQSAETLKTSP